MAGGENRRISAASARYHTRRTKQSSPLILPSGIFTKLLAISLVGILALAYQVIQPATPKIPGTPDGPPVTVPRIKLRDGRHLAYREHGMPKDVAKYKIVFVHGFDSCRHFAAVANTLSQEIIDDSGIYIVSFDRPGYGESDPDPKRAPKSIAVDIEELADKLGLGSSFYVIGYSMGGQAVWGCLKYIPHRYRSLSGVVLVAPVINYWWPKPQDQWTLRVAHYTPWLTYWWNTQIWFPASTVIDYHPDIYTPPNKALISMLPQRGPYLAQVRQQGEYETLHRDLMVGFGSWEFDPMDLENPFPNGEGSVHLWQGDDDLPVPVTLQHFIAYRLPWIKYHELPQTGHMFPYAEGMCNAMVKTLLDGETTASA
ncbi:hypothetical protein NL676_017970 [Syzygium grande]|nr:hypothetical protein NL676_017970 [Syzygium grande]